MDTSYLELLQSPKKRYDDAPIIKGSCLVIADLQIPFQDGQFLLQVLELAEKWGITQGVSAGDFFNEAAFTKLPTKPSNRDWKEEATMAENVYKAMSHYVPNWLFILGNHDAYILQELNNQLEHQDILKLSNINASSTEYYWCVIEDRLGNKWRISHPKSTSVVHGKIPQGLARKYKMNIIAGHGHLAAMSPDDSGDFCCIDSGICCDPYKLDYVIERDNLRPRMNQGAVILKEVNGFMYPYHLQPKWTDWEALGKLYKGD